SPKLAAEKMQPRSFYDRIGSTKGALPMQQVLIASAPHCFKQFVSDRQKMAQPIPQEARQTELQISIAGETLF
ncbi:MAG: hypothetical protein WAO55_05905, partial [Candidatus Manganitrophaceae bacterium]